jgi:uncharacterized protein (DUF1697 family)
MVLFILLQVGLPMKRHVAFLRAINVGGRRITNDRLTELFEELGFDDVDAYLASGNIVFDARDNPEALEAQISAHLGQAVGYDVPTFVRTMPELVALAESSVFEAEAAQANSKRYVAFLKHTLTAEQRSVLTDLANDVDQFHDDGRELHWLRQIEAGESMPTGDVEKALGVQATRRTFRTLSRLVKKYAR